MFNLCTYACLSCPSLDTSRLLKTTRSLLSCTVSIDFKSWGCDFFNMGTQVLNASQISPFSYFSKALGLQDIENQYDSSLIKPKLLKLSFYQYNYCNMTCNCSIKSIVMTCVVFVKRSLCESTSHTQLKKTTKKAD